MAFRAFAVACLFAAAAINSAFAQSDNDAPRDNRLQGASPSRTKPAIASNEDGMMQKFREGKAGMVLMDFDVKQGNAKCPNTDITLGQVVSNTLRLQTVTGPAGGDLFNKRKPMNAVVLNPGEYFITNVVCRGGGRTVLNGPFAKFQVKVGEVTNVGMLTLQFFSKYVVVNYTYTMKKSVDALTPDTKAEFANAYPTLFAKAVERRMEIVGEAEGDMTKQGKSLLFGVPCPRGEAVCL